MASASEFAFQNEMIQQLLSSGWLLGDPKKYNRELALYEEDVLGFVKDTQDEQWQKFCALYPNDTERKFLERVASQLNKADPNATSKDMRTFGTLGVLRHELRDRGTRFNLCQFKPEHDLNPDTLVRYKQNRLRVVPELVYSPWASEEELAATGKKAKEWGKIQRAAWEKMAANGDGNAQQALAYSGYGWKDYFAFLRLHEKVRRLKKAVKMSPSPASKALAASAWVSARLTEWLAKLADRTLPDDDAGTDPPASKRRRAK